MNILQYLYGHASPLAALRVFEATVRLGGLARAAVELNLTISAISHQSHTGRRESIVRRRRRPVAAGGRRNCGACTICWLPTTIPSVGLLKGDEFERFGYFCDFDHMSQNVQKWIERFDLDVRPLLRRS